MVDLLARVLVSLLRPLLSPLGECCLESINELFEKADCHGFGINHRCIRAGHGQEQIQG